MGATPVRDGEPLALTSHWPELSHMVIPGCKERWEMQSLFWVAMCPAKIGHSVTLGEKENRKSLPEPETTGGVADWGGEGGDLTFIWRGDNSLPRSLGLHHCVPTPVLPFPLFYT